MSDYHRIDPVDLDNFITGHFGEDQFRDERPDQPERCAGCGTKLSPANVLDICNDCLAESDPEEDDDEDDTDLHVPDLGEAGA